MSQLFAPGAVLGERYKVTHKVVETGDGDSIFDGQDQVLDRKVSIVVAGPSRGEKLLENARTLASSSRSHVQILDLGQSEGTTYLVTSHSRPQALQDSLLVSTAELKAASETEALGEHIFGETESPESNNAYVAVGSQKADKPAPIEASKPVGAVAAGVVAATAATHPAEDALSAEEYAAGGYVTDAYDSDEFDADDDDDSGPGMWVIAVAAVLLLLGGAAVVYSQLDNMIGSSDEASSQQPAPAASSSATASSKSSAKPSPTSTQAKLPAPKIDTVSRIVPANPNMMVDQDAMLPQTIDGNPATQWMSYGFGSANFGGTVDSFALAYELEKETNVAGLTIDQVSGSGGSFTVLTNDTNSLEGAQEVGSGTFNAPQVKVDLDEKKQDGKTKYVFIRFDEAPVLSQPITPNFIYGVRIAEVSVD